MYQVNFPYLNAMKPYESLLTKVLLVFVALLGASAAAAMPGEDGKKPAKPASKGPSPAVSGARLFTLDPLTKSGTAHLYNLEYDKAISDFEAAHKQYPGDPFAVNHLIQGLLFKELYRLNALDTTLYTDNGFLTGKPLPGDAQTKVRIFELADESLQLSEKRLKANANDVEALYARGVTRGLKLTYVAIIEKSFFAALRNASASRGDHEHVLQLDANYVDAKTVVGLHNFVVGSMPLAARIMAGVVGMSGSKKKGLDYLYEVARSDHETSVDARVALALFLRREARYQDALEVVHMLTSQYPHNFIFALEEANLLKDAGKGEEAIAAYARILESSKSGAFADPHLERAAYGLAESLKGQRKTQEALQEYESAITLSKQSSDGVRIRALLGAGEMYDALGKRNSALKEYAEAISIDGSSAQAELARKYIRAPFQFSGSN
jgi:tetratricopeptide (TPR) repeat protein